MQFDKVSSKTVVTGLLALLWRERIEGEGGLHGIGPHPFPLPRRERETDDARSKIYPGLGLALLILLTASSIAQARDLPLIRIGQSSITDVQVASIVTQQAGIFRKYGLDAELILLQGGPLTVQALISGSIDFADVAGPAVIGSQLAGAEVVSLLYQIVGVTHSLFVRSDIQAAKDLKGKRVGVVRIGGLAESIALYMLTEKLGLNAAEVKLVQVGGQAERVAALESGAIQATVFSPPQSTRVKKLGFKEITDASELEYPTGVIATTKQTLALKPDLVERVVKSYLEGIAFFWLHKDKTVPMLQRQFRLSDAAEAEEMYDKLAKVVPKKPRPPLKGIKTVLESLKDRNQRAAAMEPAVFVDSALVRKLEAQGFIDRLYR